MEQFLIEIPHGEQNCLNLMRLLCAWDDLSNFEWGCQNGVHTCWGVIRADNEAEARLVVPPSMRAEARVVRVNRFDAATIAEVPKNEPVLPSPAMVHMYRAFPCWW
jgi:hypothetical protein